MHAEHADKELARIETDPAYIGALGQPLARSFRKVMNVIRNVPNEASLNRMFSLHCEKLKGARQHQRSLRLNDQWRLIIEIEKREGGNCLIIRGIEDYQQKTEQ